MKDARGTEIKIGQMVAYNYQGEVAFGEIIFIIDEVLKDSGHGWSHTVEKAKIKIKRMTHLKMDEVKPRSTVTSPRNLIVIKEYDALRKAAKEIYEAFSLWHEGHKEEDFINFKVKEWTNT